MTRGTAAFTSAQRKCAFLTSGAMTVSHTAMSSALSFTASSAHSTAVIVVASVARQTSRMRGAFIVSATWPSRSRWNSSSSGAADAPHVPSVMMARRDCSSYSLM